MHAAGEPLRRARHARGHLAGEQSGGRAHGERAAQQEVHKRAFELANAHHTTIEYHMPIAVLVRSIASASACAASTVVARAITIKLCDERREQRAR